MYIDLSLRKLGVLLFVVFLLLWSVVLTFDLKDRRYGSTPPFAAAGLTFKEAWLKMWYTLEGSARNVSQTAGAAAAFITGRTETDISRTARAIPVLTYHRIVSSQNDLNNVTEDNFKDQMLTLKRAGWETITLEEYREFMEGNRKLPEKSFLITFDDGAKESFYPVDPLFEMLGYEGVMYIIASAMHIPESTYYLSPPEITRMLETGRWEIGSHSFDGHRPYPADETGVDGIFFADKLWRPLEQRLETTDEFTARVREDLARAKPILEDEYGVSVETFAFPLGNETGIEGAANFPEGAAITEREAANIYGLGFLQTDRHRYSFNYPDEADFLALRIHVDYDWDGERLLQELEGGLPKDLPFEDDFSEDRGWIPAWGNLDLGRNNMTLSADEGSSSASAFLDGSRPWSSYSYNAALNWTNGSVFLLADVRNSKSYNACVFSDGVVRIQSTKDGETSVLAEESDARIVRGENVTVGIRVRGAVIECLWDFGSIAEVYERPTDAEGGVGLQVWDPVLGTAALTVAEIVVRPL